MPEKKIEAHCREARKLIQQAQIKIRDAVCEASDNNNHEVSKALDSTDNLLAGVVGLLISVPRLKG